MTGQDTGQDIDPRDLRRAFGAFATGVTVVTTRDQAGQPLGFTANSFTSVSLEPPLLLVCLAKTAGSYPVFADCGHFAVNILAADQHETSAVFATRGEDKFSAVNWEEKTTGSPVIEEVVAWFDCNTHDTIDAGDHLIMIGQVVAYNHGTSTPLGYCRGAYVSFDLAREAQRAIERPGRVSVGAIVTHEGRLMLEENPTNGTLRLPSAARLGRTNDPESLLGRLAAEGIAARLPFLFAVFDHNDTHFIFFRGEVDAGGGDNRFRRFADLPWDRIADPAERSMLQRFVAEQERDQFGIYVGDATTGDVHNLD